MRAWLIRSEVGVNIVGGLSLSPIAAMMALDRYHEMSLSSTGKIPMMRLDSWNQAIWYSERTAKSAKLRGHVRDSETVINGKGVERLLRACELDDMVENGVSEQATECTVRVLV